ncbi:MAG TPA: transposase [Phycisphaerae bacterium]|nr:transposase [Phycisphaerae bacterium]HNU46951.1 transposase [Phycisphaerae bacterium]
MSGSSSVAAPSPRKSCHRENTPGHAHALTFSCFHRQAFLTRERTCRWFVDALAATRDKHGFDLWAFVIMPEHVHVLIRPLRDVYSISAILASLKLRVSRRAERYVRECAPRFLDQMTDVQPNGQRCVRFWQRGGGYDRNLSSLRYVWEMIDYIHGNPLRRGLCAHPADWLWSSARYYEDRAAGPLRLDLDSLPPDPRPPLRL